jgi:hypothetical protein
MAAEVGSQ